MYGKVRVKPDPPLQDQTLWLCGARDRKIVADLGQRLCFPTENVSINFRPDIVLWSSSLQLVYIIEFAVLWMDGVDEAYERKQQVN